MGASGKLAKEHPWEYLMASAMSAAINYPLWRTSAIGQSGFRVVSMPATIPPVLSPYVYGFLPPYKGMMATIVGMTWARAAIFWGSDRGRELWLSYDPDAKVAATVMPPLIVSTLVQVINQPIVRASVTIQNPESNVPNVRSAVRTIYQNHGLKGLWHGTSAGILKTVPKYCTAIVVKDYMEEVVFPTWDEYQEKQGTPPSSRTKSDDLRRSALKSAAAGVAGAALTNPLDVIRNEMFKTNRPLIETVNRLYSDLGWRFLVRGMGKNVLAVSIPVGCTIFFTDALISYSRR